MPDISNIDFLYKSNFHYKSKMNEWFLCKPLYQIRRGYVFVIVIVKYFRNAKEFGDNITNTNIPTIQLKKKKKVTININPEYTSLWFCSPVYFPEEVTFILNSLKFAIAICVFNTLFYVCIYHSINCVEYW